jgi:hypothetical protein
MLRRAAVHHCDSEAGPCAGADLAGGARLAGGGCARGRQACADSDQREVPGRRGAARARPERVSRAPSPPGSGGSAPGLRAANSPRWEGAGCVADVFQARFQRVSTHQDADLGRVAHQDADLGRVAPGKVYCMGKLEYGTVRTGDTLALLPAGTQITVVQVFAPRPSPVQIGRRSLPHPAQRGRKSFPRFPSTSSPCASNQGLACVSK